MRRCTIALAALLAATLWPPRADSTGLLPNRPGTVKFAVLGDNGTGDRPQYDVAAQMAVAHAAFPFDLVLMLGDNFYGSQGAEDLVRKFEQPYKPLLDAGVRFQAVVGNHDEPDTVHYAPLNMGGQRYYSFSRGDVRFFALDSNAVDPKQIAWVRAALASSPERWKIAYFHHALYSNAGRHGTTVDVRLLLEPLLVAHGVDVVFSGHDHVYERLRPQQGITYFVVGSGGKLRRGDLRPSATTAAGFDQDNAFLLAEIDGDTMSFDVISRTGRSVDAGVIRRGPTLSGPTQ
jgi:3',5'-cyclic AMP phosphodiesterase CpdA